MGDPRRFQAFADFIAERWPDRCTRIADVAAGKGYLRAALYQRGYRDVSCFDLRAKKAARPYYRYELFMLDTLPDFDLVVGMHPDEATDVLIAYAAAHDLPFAVVPCCVKPTLPYSGERDYDEWMSHLQSLAPCEVTALPISGRNATLVAA